MSRVGSVDLGHDNAAFESEATTDCQTRTRNVLSNPPVDVNNEISAPSDDEEEKKDLEKEPAVTATPSHSGTSNVTADPDPVLRSRVNGTPSMQQDPPPPFTPKAGDIVDVLSMPSSNGKSSNGLENPQFAQKLGDPEAPAAPERGQWSNQMEFLLSCIAMSVGLGNIWRFPFTAYENGGGAFLIPYIVVLLFVGRPIYFLELCLGQFCSLSQVKVWRINPFFRGVGYGSMIATMLVVSYYCSIMALTVFYFVISFQKDLPWDTCNDRWAGNCTALGNDSKSIAQLYYEKEVLKEYDHIYDGIGAPEWRMTLCLLFAWAVVLFSLIKGVKSSGKVAYFTALFPYVVLLSLLIRGVTLDGAWDGIKYFIEPQWDKIYEPKVWYAAVSQCFYSLNTGFGSVIMFSSYNPFSHNIYRDAIILSFMDTFTSLLAGFTIFSVLGNLSFTTGIPVKDVLDGGNGLAFISYPQAIANFPWAPQLFAVLFFLMLFTLGIGSATADAGAIISIFADQFPTVKRWKIVCLFCGSAFAFGLVYVTPGGQFILNMVDTYTAFVIFATSTLEVIAVAWFYGLDNFIDDIEFMLKIRIGWYWKICWGYVIPVMLTAILIYTFAVDYEPLSYKGVQYPTVGDVFGWLIAATALAALPVLAIMAVRKSKKSTFVEKLKDSTTATDQWGPADPKIRREWLQFKKEKVMKKIGKLNVKCDKIDSLIL